jgi:hypothetical protein
MIFLLNSSVDDLSGLPADEIEDLFTALLDADRSGRHLVVISRTICSWGVENIELSGQNRRHLCSLREQFSTRGNIHSYASSHLEIVVGDGLVTKVGDHFRVGHTHFSSNEYGSSKTMMIVENLNADSKLYEFMLGVAMKQTAVPSLAVDFVLGGGNTTVTAFEAEINKHRIAICAVDADRISPCDRLGDTARKVMNRHSKRNLEPDDPAAVYVGIAVETIGHELENYIPLSAVKLINTFNCPNTLDPIVSQVTHADSLDCFWLYFDTKKGLDGTKVVAKINTGKKPVSTRQWICEKTGTPDQDFGSLKIPCIGGSVVEHFLTHDAAKQQYIEFSKTEYWKTLFLQHFELLLWFLAAPQISRS